MADEHTKPTPRIRVRTPRMRVRAKQVPTKPPEPVTVNPPNKRPAHFTDGGSVHPDAVRVGASGSTRVLGYVIPTGQGPREAYVQRRDGTREYLGLFNRYPDAHRAVVKAHRV